MRIGLLLGAVLAAAAAAPVSPAAAMPAAAAFEPRPGQILHAARPVTLRTRGSGNLGVDLPRGRAVQVLKVHADRVLLGPAPADADLLRQFGVRKIPRYTVTRDRLGEDFLLPAGWEAERLASRRRLRERWPGLGDDQADRIAAGEFWIGMAIEQAEEAVGVVIFAREVGPAPDGETWRIGRRPRSAEQRAFIEGRERGPRAATFEEHLRLRTRAVLRFRGGTLVAVEPP